MVYLWTKYGPPRLLEIFDGREDLEKKPEIPKDSDKSPEIPAASGWAKKIHDKHLKKEERNNGKGR